MHTAWTYIPINLLMRFQVNICFIFQNDVSATFFMQETLNNDEVNILSVLAEFTAVFTTQYATTGVTVFTPLVVINQDGC